jgi:hypothetical protein
MLKKNRPCPRGQLLAFTIRSMGVCRRYSIYLHIFHLIPLFESRKTASNSSRLLTASYFPISSVFFYTSVITVNLDGVGESYTDSYGDSRGWRHALCEARAEAVDIIFRRFRKNAKWDRLLASSCLSVCPSVRPSVRSSVCPSAWKNSAPNSQIFMKFDIWVFLKNLSRKFRFH